MCSSVSCEECQAYGFSPCQLIFGRNPNLPGDLLDEPQNVVANTIPLMDDRIASACSTRAAARKALLELQDSKSMRRALLARPCVARDFQAGDVVAYWRDQKWNQGTLSKGGRWYGSGVVLVLVGKCCGCSPNSHHQMRSRASSFCHSRRKRHVVRPPKPIAWNQGSHG